MLLKLKATLLDKEEYQTHMTQQHKMDLTFSESGAGLRRYTNFTLPMDFDEKLFDEMAIGEEYELVISKPKVDKKVVEPEEHTEDCNGTHCSRCGDCNGYYCICYAR